MKCQKCDKTATFHITDITDGCSKEVHLCDEHASEYLHQHKSPGFFSDKEEKFSTIEDDEFTEVDSELSLSELEPNLKGLTEELEDSDSNYCDCCQRSFLDFRKSGKLGCENDYTAFQESLEPLLLGVHGASRHVGKRPSRANNGALGSELVRLRNELQDAIRIEDYETASMLRDRINELTKRLDA